MKSKKLQIIGTFAIYAVIFSLIAGFIYFDTHYAVINKKIYNRNDIPKSIGSIYFGLTNIREINKCTEVESMFLHHAPENSISKLKDFHNLKDLMILGSDISSADCEKISQFDKLEELIFSTTTVDFKGFKSDTLSSIGFASGTFKNFEVLAECKSLKRMIIGPYHTNIMEDISVFAYFDYVESLSLSIDKIEDISGILEMDSLKELKIDKGAISEDNVKLLEDKGISVIEYD